MEAQKSIIGSSSSSFHPVNYTQTNRQQICNLQGIKALAVMSVVGALMTNVHAAANTMESISSNEKIDLSESIGRKVLSEDSGSKISGHLFLGLVYGSVAVGVTLGVFLLRCLCKPCNADG